MQHRMEEEREGKGAVQRTMSGGQNLCIAVTGSVKTGFKSQSTIGTTTNES